MSRQGIFHAPQEQQGTWKDHSPHSLQPALPKIGTWAKSNNTSIQTSRHLLALQHKVLVCKAHKGGSSGADVRGSSNNTRNSIHSVSKNTSPRRNNLHGFRTNSSCSRKSKMNTTQRHKHPAEEAEAHP